MKSRYYVGITGITSKEEISKVCREFKDAGIYEDPKHMPMVGILASYKTLNNFQIKNRRYPKISKIFELLQEAGNKNFRTIHYNTRKLDSLFNQISNLIEEHYSNKNLEGIQLNMTFPPTKQLERINNKFPELKIIFQANSHVINSGTKTEVARKIQEYNLLVDYVLIDASGGRGKEIDIEDSLNFAKEIQEKSPNLIIGFAGGFNKNNVCMKGLNLISRLKGFDFCIDAEGGLRDKLSNNYGDDLLNINKVKGYLQEFSRLSKSFPNNHNP